MLSWLDYDYHQFDNHVPSAFTIWTQSHSQMQFGISALSEASMVGQHLGKVLVYLTEIPQPYIFIFSFIVMSC